jgi:hypothetical protein
MTTDLTHSWSSQVILKNLTPAPKVFLVPLADLHIGSRDVDLDMVQGYVDWIKANPDAYTIFNGDLMNCADKDSTPELYEDLVTPDMGYAQLREIVLPIKDRVLMITRGGHEEHIFRKSGHDFMAQLAHDLGDVPYQPDGGMVGVRMGQAAGYGAVYWVYATHGWGGARSAGAKVNKIEELATCIEADVYVLSHDHTQNIHRINTIVPPARFQWGRPAYMTVRRKLLINTGGFVKYAGYIQRKGYMPQDLGTPKITMEIKVDARATRYKDLHASM